MATLDQLALDPAPTALSEVLSPAWLQAAMRLDGPIDDVRVVETIRVSATKVRFVAERTPEPLQLCVKGFFDDDAGPRQAEISQAEARFYADIAPTVSDLQVPRCHHAGVSPVSGQGVVLMDDVTARRGRFLTVLEPYAPAQVAETLGQLARLHAAHWDRPSLRGFSWLTSRVDWMVETPIVPRDILQELMAGERGLPLSAGIRDAGRIMSALAAVAEEVRAQPACVVHGDAHAGNVFELGGKLGFVDWQLVQRGSWSLDVAYHLGVALSIEDRRAFEEDLVRHYLGELQALGVKAPSFAEAWLAYRAHLTYGYYLWAVTRRVAPPIILEMVRRLGTAVDDHDSFGLLGR